MSVELHVYCKKGVLPPPEAWQKAIATAGFKVELDVDFDPISFTGFLPATYRGKPGGFEYFVEDADPEEGPEDLGKRDTVVMFLTHSDMRELATSVIAACVLTTMTEGILVDLQAGEEMTAAEALDWAREMENEIQGDLD